MKTHNKNNPTTGVMGLLAFFARTLTLLPAVAALLLGGAQTTLAATFEVTEADCSVSPGGWQWAVEQANANPGRDTIQIRKDFGPGNCPHHSGEQYPDFHVTESVDIVGNGFYVLDDPMWINPNGQVNPLGSCPHTGYDTLISDGSAFIDIGQRNIDNQGVEVTINGLNMRNLYGVAIVRKGAKLTIENAYIHDIYSVHQFGLCDTPIIEADQNVDLTLRNVKFSLITLTTGAFMATDFPVSIAVIDGGRGGGNLVMDRVTMEEFVGDHATAIRWVDGTVKIVNSQMVSSHGIWLNNAAMDFVNSTYLVGPAGVLFNDNFLIDKSTVKFQASTFWWGLTGDPCDRTRPGSQCAPKVTGFYAVHPADVPVENSGSNIRFEGSAIGAYAFGTATHPDPSWAVLMGDPSQYNSDAMTWFQPRGEQNAAAINAILPNALTALPGLHDFPSFYSNEYYRDITPLVPGVLIEAVPNAGSGGANELLNPIDNLPTPKDVLGKPRVYGNNTRNIGAVQNPDAPVLKASGGDSTADLGWNTPIGTITGYEICTSPSALTDPFVGNCTGTSTLVNDPTKTAQTIASLINGSPYWFVIRSFNGVAPGIWSNVATSTPYATVGIPTVSGIPGDNQVQLFWTEPATGGHPGPLSYFVVYRVKGQTQWVNGPGYLSGRTTRIPELAGGTEYEFGVAVQAFDGAASPVAGITTATPLSSQAITFGAAPVVSVGGTGKVSATGGGSGNPVTFASATPGVCAVNGNIATGLAVGTCSITADQAGNANYAAAPQATQNFSVGLSQTVSFGLPPMLSVGVTGPLSATGGASGNPVTYTSATPGVCTVNGNTVTGVAPGTCTIVATQAGNGSYNAASQSTQSFNIGQGNPANAEIECLFTWAEHTYPGLFAPAGALTTTWGPYTYRYYAGTHAYLGVSTNNRVYYMDEFGTLHDEGPLGDWLPRAGCQPVPPPSDCLFNWAQQYFPDLFGPAGFVTQVSGEYYYRYYSATNTYLGISSIDGNVYYMGSDRQLQGQGPLSLWLKLAGCQ